MSTFNIYPLGDAAMTVEWEAAIHPDIHEKVLAANYSLKQDPFEGLKELVIAYHTLTVYYDPFIIKSKYQPESTVSEWVKKALESTITDNSKLPARMIRRHEVPVCYDLSMGTDLERIAEEKHLPVDEIIKLHTTPIYRIYMTGFQPGFPYLGELPNILFTQRKSKPEVVESGSVAIAGLQTGIYPFSGPGGWNVIGRTPWVLFDPALDVPVSWEPGDEVKFIQISAKIFEHLKKKKIHVDPGT